jgi:hypothetical protein
MHIGCGSYITSHDQKGDSFERLISTFFDGVIHSRIGTHDFKLPIKNAQHLEAVCPVNNTLIDSTTFGEAVSQRAAEGDGWLSWLVAIDTISTIKKRLDHEVINGHGTKPDKKELAWSQIGVQGTLKDKQIPLFIELLLLDQPLIDRKAFAKIVKIEIAGDESRIEDWLGSELHETIGADIEVELDALAIEGESGIVTVPVITQCSVVRLE